MKARNLIAWLAALLLTSAEFIAIDLLFTQVARPALLSDGGAVTPAATARTAHS